FSPDGNIVATGGDDGTLRLWDPGTGAETAQLPKHNSAVSSVVFAHSGKFLLSSEGDGSLRFWDFTTSKEQPPLPRSNGSIRRLALSADDKALAVVPSSSQDVELWDLETRSLRLTISGHHSTILAIAFAPDGRTLATGNASGSIQLWDADTGKERGAFNGNSR